MTLKDPTAHKSMVRSEEEMELSLQDLMSFV